jgi:hypothetical protein
MSNGATGWRWGWAQAGDSAQRRHDAFAHEGIRTTIAGRTHQKLERVAEEIGCWRDFSGCLPGRMNSVARADIARLLGINRDGGSTNGVGSRRFLRGSSATRHQPRHCGSW